MAEIVVASSYAVFGSRVRLEFRCEDQHSVDVVSENFSGIFNCFLLELFGEEKMVGDLIVRHVPQYRVIKGLLPSEEEHNGWLHFTVRKATEKELWGGFDRAKSRRKRHGKKS